MLRNSLVLFCTNRCAISIIRFLYDCQPFKRQSTRQKSLGCEKLLVVVIWAGSAFTLTIKHHVWDPSSCVTLNFGGDFPVRLRWITYIHLTLAVIAVPLGSLTGLTFLLNRSLVSKLKSPEWNRKHASAVLQLIDCVLRLLNVNRLRTESLEDMTADAASDSSSDQFALCLCSYQLLLTCLVRLPDLPPATGTIDGATKNTSLGRPRVEYTAELCAQLAKCISQSSTSVYRIHCASVYTVSPQPQHSCPFCILVISGTVDA